LRIPPPHTFEAFLGLFLQTNVAALDDGSLAISVPFSDETHWLETEPNLFRNVNDKDFVGFQEDEQGQIRYLVPSGSVMEKVPWYDAAIVQVPMLLASTAVFLLTPLVWLAGMLVRRLRHQPATLSHRTTRTFVNLVCLCNLGFLVGLGYLLASYPQSVIYGATASVVAVFVLPLVSAGLTAGCILCAARLWQQTQSGTRARIGYTFFATLSLGFLLFLHHWNLLGFRF
jgi:hypothetical protein